MDVDIIVMSTEARTLMKADADGSEGSEQRRKTRRQQEFGGGGRSDLHRFELSSPTRDYYTSANFVEWLAEARSGRATALGDLENVDSSESSKEKFFPRPEGLAELPAWA